MSEWISVNDMMPGVSNIGENSSKAVLVHCPGIECSFTAIRKHGHNSWVYFGGIGTSEIYDEVTHWMPLPAPPTTEGEK